MKLTIELVPSTVWYSNVRSNVSRDEWDRLRTLVYQHANHHCEICGGQGKKWPVECHEIWEYNDTRRVQRLDKLIALCPMCHQVKHIGLAGIKGNYDIAVAHLARVNDLSLAAAKKYVADQFLVWEERSKHDWLLDISALKKYKSDENEGW